MKKSQQRAKLLQARAREEKDGKKTYSRFTFPVPKKKKVSPWLVAARERRKRLQEAAAESNTNVPESESSAEDMQEAATEDKAVVPDFENVAKTPVVPDFENVAKTPTKQDAQDVAGVEEAMEIISPESPSMDVAEPEVDVDLQSESDAAPSETVISTDADASVPNQDETDELGPQRTVSPVDEVVKEEPNPINEPEGKDSSEVEQDKDEAGESNVKTEIEEGEVSSPESVHLSPESPKESSQVDESDARETDIEMEVEAEKTDDSDKKGHEIGQESSKDEGQKNLEDEAIVGKETEDAEPSKQEKTEDSEAKPQNDKDDDALQSENKESQEILPETADEANADSRDKHITEAVSEGEEEEDVPTFVVLEREEISSDEGEFDALDQGSGDDKDPSKSEPPLPSIFQQTEAISSDEELDDIVPPAASQKSESAKEKAEEEKSEGEVDDAAMPIEEGDPITKLTEDISGDELSGDDLQNPATPTMDEPTEFEGMEEGGDGQPAIPVIRVNSPKGKGLEKEQGIARGYSSGSASEADDAKKREGTPKIEEGGASKTEKKEEEIEEGELDEIEEGEVPEEKEQRPTRGTRYRGLSDQDNLQEEQTGYGKRPRRRTYSPHHGKDDDYLYFGLPKRTRRDSPTAAQEVVQKKPATRYRKKSGGIVGNQTKEQPALETPGTSKQQEEVPAVTAERRSSRYSRRVSPPRRYSPSEQRTAPKAKGQGVSTPPAATSPVPMVQEPTSPQQQQQQQQQQPHRHFTRRMSGRDEERRPHRYEDMYYYDSKRTKTNTNPTQTANKPARRGSAEEKKKKR